MRETVTRQSPQTVTVAERGEPKLNGTEVLLLTSLHVHLLVPGFLKRRPPWVFPRRHRPRYLPQTPVSVTGGSCHKYHFCRDKTYVATNMYKCLLRQSTTRHTTKLCLFCVFRDKTKYFCRDKFFVTTNILLSRQTRDKNDTCGGSHQW